MTSFQVRAGVQGKAYEDAVVSNLTSFGWLVQARNWVEDITGVEIDIVAADRDGQVWWIECKGSWESKSNRNGLTRTDTTKKLIANAALLATLADRRPYMVVTSDEPLTGSARTQLDIAIAQGWVARVQRLVVL